MALIGDRQAQLRHVCDTFKLWPTAAVETGTWTGETTAALADVFLSVHTVELAPKYHTDAVAMFAGRNVRCLLGDSAVVVPQLAAEIAEPVFWYLDAHYWDIPLYSEWAPHREWWAGADRPHPLFAELSAILTRPYPDIIVVDDIHAFGAEAKWEDITIPKLEEIVRPSKTCSLSDSFCMLRWPDGYNPDLHQ